MLHQHPVGRVLGIVGRNAVRAVKTAIKKARSVQGGLHECDVNAPSIYFVTQSLGSALKGEFTRAVGDVPG